MINVVIEYTDGSLDGIRVANFQVMDGMFRANRVNLRGDVVRLEIETNIIRRLNVDGVNYFN